MQGREEKAIGALRKEIALNCSYNSLGEANMPAIWVLLRHRE